MTRAAAFIREAGGAEQSRVFTRMWLSLIGLWSWKGVPTLPPEQILLPPRAPLSVYSFGCWARQTIVALSVVTALEPSRPVGFGIDEVLSGGPSPSVASDLWGKVFVLVDRAAHAYARRPVGLLRRQALRTAERWIVERQERDGSWGGIQPPWVWSIVALHALGYPLDHPVLARAIDGLDNFTIEDDEGRRLEACQSPVWDTALSVLALLDAGVDPERPGDRPRVRVAVGAGGRHARRLGGAPARARPGRLRVRVRERELPRRRRHGSDRPRAAARRARPDRRGRPRRSSGCSGCRASRAASARSTSTTRAASAAKLAFCDFGAVTDPPSSDVTAHVLETLAYEGRAADGPATRALSWLLRQQERDGSWFGRWGANYIYGTGAVLPALAACGLADHESVAAAVGWLEQVQNPGGGFGEDLRSYQRPLLERPRRVDRVADGLGAARASRRRRGREPRSDERGANGSSRRSSAAEAGTSRTSRAPASRATSISTTTSTGTCSR